jgi:hypothetical protein
MQVWVGPRAGLKIVEERKIFYTCQNRNPESSSPYLGHCTDSAVLVSPNFHETTQTAGAGVLLIEKRGY